MLTRKDYIVYFVKVVKFGAMIFVMDEAKISFPSNGVHTEKKNPPFLVYIEYDSL